MTEASSNSLPEQIKDKINEISLLLVMTSEQDEAGIDMLCELFDSIEGAAPSESSCTRLVQAWQQLKSQKGILPIKGFYEALQQLVSNAVAFCDNPESAKFDNEKMPTKSSESKPTEGRQPEALVGVDASFLPEFIENHRMQLEDFESWLLDCQFNSGTGESKDALVKRFIHSLKGDAYSIGVNEIGDACHFVEDILAQTPMDQLVGQLMFFKEWIISYLDALTKGVTPEESSRAFIDRFTQACSLLLPKLALTTDTAAGKQSSSSNQSPSKIPQSYQLSGEMDIFQEFAAEALEHLGNVESVILDSNGAFDKDSVDTIFRGIHSLKGGSAYFTFKEMTETSHLLENMLDEVRGGKRELGEALTGLVMTYIDLQKGLLATAKEAVLAGGVISRSESASSFLKALNDYIENDANGLPHAELAPVNTPAKSTSPSASPSRSSDTAVAVVPKENSPAAKAETLEVKNFVKVDMQRLDHLIDSIGEMVIYSSMLIRRCRDLLADHEDVITTTHRVEKFTRDLQDVGLSMRLVPIKSLFQKMSRLVFDTSKKIKKDISFSMDGEDTELDRNLIDKLADPLMHMVRNALDHGIEPGDEREKIGKPRVGVVHLSASHSGGSILIKIQDDGRGLDPEKLLAKARLNGIIAEGQKLSEQDIFQLIFAAGFSTAAVVTDISGRGVGMDVVRRNVESLRGNIHIESEVGKGTVFTIELPLTLAIVDGIEVTVGTEHLVIPSLSIIEFLKPTKDVLNSALDQGETLQFRGKYLPVFRISDLYDIEPRYSNPLDATFIVVENNEELIALMVDEIIGELSTVIKSLGTLFSEVKGVSGCAVMPNGDVALILDVRSLVQLARSDYRRNAAPGAQLSLPN